MKVLIPVFALMLTLQNHIATATSYPVLYVGPNGEIDWPCGTVPSQPCKNISTAVAHANNYATTNIKVARGDYSEYIPITSNLPASSSGQLTIEGGWNADFTVQSHDPALTRVAPSSDSPVININLGALAKVDLRLSYLSFHGTTDLQRTGINANSSNATVNLALEHCRISSFRGEAVYLNATLTSAMSVTVYETSFQGNYQPQGVSPWQGAAFYANSTGGSNTAVTMTNNMIVNNHASSGGALSFNSNGAVLNATLANNILAENSASGSGGAIWASAVGTSASEMVLNLTNNTISNNHAAALGDGIYFITTGSAKGTAYVKNTIAHGNGTDLYLQQADTSTLSVTADYSIIGEVIGDFGTYNNKSSNLNVDPLLTSNYHISPASPAKDKGICGLSFLFVYSRIAPYDDIDGDARPGYNTISGCDIGADEYHFPWPLFNPVFMQKQ